MIMEYQVVASEDVEEGDVAAYGYIGIYCIPVIYPLLSLSRALKANSALVVISVFI
jgi:hypothetical protein